MKTFKKYLTEAKKFKKGNSVVVKDLKEYGEITDIRTDGGVTEYYVRFYAGGTSDWFHGSELRLYYGRK